MTRDEILNFTSEEDETEDETEEQTEDGGTEEE